MTSIAWVVIAAAMALVAYTYIGYPALLRVAASRRLLRRPNRFPEWPSISITVPAYNEAAQIRDLIENLLRLDYPVDRRQILIVSDASSDGMDAIVAEYADQGVELLRIPERGGKTVAENAAMDHLRGEIIVNTDASIRFRPESLKPLIASFVDEDVGVASGRDISIARVENDPNTGESRYVGYEMWVRQLETRLGGIVGASGCFYAIRSHLHRRELPPSLTRDFAAALIAREKGFRAVSVDEAVCFVPRTASLQREYRRKVRTMAGGLETLFHFSHLLNPFRYGRFAWKLFSHKLCRWLVPWALLLALVAMLALATAHGWGPWALVVLGGGSALALMGWLSPEGARVPRVAALAAFAVAGNLAVLQAWLQALRGGSNATWEPTRRDVASAGSR